MCPSLYQEEKDDSKAQETLVNGEGKTNLPLFTEFFLLTSVTDSPFPEHLLFSLVEDGI